MANLSNINGKFVVEQTTGYVGVGTTDPNYPIEVLNASAEIALNASGGSTYRIQSDSASNFIIRKAGVGDRLVINSAGNVNIGSSLSAEKLEVGGTIRIRVPNTSSATLLLNNTDTQLSIDNTGGNMIFTTAGAAERMRITSGGNIGIGTGSDALVRKFTVDSGTQNIGIKVKSTDPGSTISFEDNTTNGDNVQIGGVFDDMYMVAGGGERMRINSSGDVGIGTTPQASGPTWRTLFIGASATIVSRQNASGYDSIFANNYYVNSSNQDRVRTTGPSSRMFLDGDNIRFQISPTNSTAPSWSEIMRIDDSGNVGIGVTTPNALLTMKDAAYVQEWNRAKGFYQHTTATGSAAGNFNISTIINTNNLRGLTVDYYESGHYYNNGGNFYFRHTRLYIMIESSLLRVGTAVLIQSLGNVPSAIVSAPTVTASGTHQATIVSTILSGYTHYVSVDVVGSGFGSFNSIS
jgi:hypothetical protein